MRLTLARGFLRFNQSRLDRAKGSKMTEQNQDGAGANGQDSGAAGAGGNGEVNFSSMTIEQARAAAAQYYNEKAHANFEAQKKGQALREKDAEVQRLSARDAELKKLEDAQKTEAQKNAERAAQLERELANERQARAHAQDMVAVMAGGVAEPYAEFMATQLARARGSAGDAFNAKEFLVGQQKVSPAFFGSHQEGSGSEQPPMKVAGGGPGVGSNKKAQIQADLVEIDKMLEAAQMARDPSRIWELQNIKSQRLRELAQ